MTEKEYKEKRQRVFESMWRYRDFYGEKKWKKMWARDTGMTPEETDKKYEELKKEIKP